MKYLVFLFLSLTFLGCTKSKIKDTCENNTIKITPSNYNSDSAIIFNMTAFTPNGDGLNDLFRPIISGIDISSFEVCKRNKVIYTADENNPKWDGKDQDGNTCKDGVYKYVIKGNNSTDGDFEILGDVSLITEDINQNCMCKYEDMISPTQGFVNPSSESCDGH